MGALFKARAGRRTAVCLLGIGLFCCGGCVSKKIEPEDIPRVAASQNSKGVVTLTWPSKKGYRYRLLVLDIKTREWKPVEGLDAFEGTGEIITVQDQQNPNNPLPWYSVRPEKMKN